MYIIIVILSGRNWSAETELIWGYVFKFTAESVIIHSESTQFWKDLKFVKSDARVTHYKPNWQEIFFLFTATQYKIQSPVGTQIDYIEQNKKIHHA